MRTLAGLLALALTLATLVVLPGASAAPCQGDNQVVMDDVRDTSVDPLHVECGSLTEPCFTTDSCPRGCGGGTDSPVTWLIGPIYCV